MKMDCDEPREQSYLCLHCLLRPTITYNFRLLYSNIELNDKTCNFGTK